jgi:small-conductance mechanosensitive channel
MAAWLIAIVALVLADTQGGLVHTSSSPQLVTTKWVISLVATVVYLVVGVTAVRSTTHQVIRALPDRIGDARAAPLRLICLLIGYLLVVYGGLTALRVDPSRLLLGGAITSIIIGLAAQQALGNLFAGLVLLIVRPFTVGDTLAIRSGALGGRIEGRVSDMTLTYVRVETVAGPVLVPNSGVLAAAIGPSKPWDNET